MASARVGIDIIILQVMHYSNDFYSYYKTGAGKFPIDSAHPIGCYTLTYVAHALSPRARM